MTRRIVVRLQLVPAISSSKLGGGRSGRDGIVVDLEQVGGEQVGGEVRRSEEDFLYSSNWESDSSAMLEEEEREE